MPNKKPDKKKETLDLIEKPKKSRRQRQRDNAPKKETLADKKAAALDIFSDKGGAKRTNLVKKTKRSGKDPLAPISKILDDEQKEVAEKEQKETADKVLDKTISIKPPIVVADLAERMNLKGFELMKDLIGLEVFVAPHQAIEPDVAEKVCKIHGFTFAREKREKGAGVRKVSKKIKAPESIVDEPVGKLEYRAPIITFMGHVDHGKTSLLDYFRKSKLVSSEAGGITQHINAYRIMHDDKPITFLDTPGHAIFSAMRARGADVTDIVVIVIAANDGIMPQTKEAISHAKAAKKAIIVAINKCDLPAADVTRVKTQLMEEGLNPVDFGGDIETVEVSAHTGQGMQDLLDLLALQAEVLELKANPKATARGTVIESRIQQGQGPTATIIVESGTLKQGDAFICGAGEGKVKSLLNDQNDRIKEAGPSTPVELLGFSSLPLVGDEVVVMQNAKAAKKLSEERKAEIRTTSLGEKQKTRIEDMLFQVGDGPKKAVLSLILKTDVQGSVQAIKGAIEEIQSEKVECRFLHTAAGAITETDIMLASSSDAIIMGFNTKVEGKAVKAAKSEGVQIKLYSIVYELIDTVRDAMLGLLEPETRESVIGHAEVKQVFKVHKGFAAGCYVTNGKIQRTSHARVLRGKTPVFDGKMSTLRRFKDEVKEVKSGTECGIRLGDFNEYEEGDIIECYNLEKIDQTL